MHLHRRSLTDNCTDKLSSDLSQLLLNGEDSDLTIRVKGTEFCLHRNIMGVRTPVFSAMLRHDMKEKATGVVCIDDCEPEVFRAFVQYLYSGMVSELTTDTVFELFSLADKYRVDELKSSCLEFIRSSLSVDTFCEVLNVALTYEQRDLLVQVTDFFAQHMKDILKTVKWMNFMRDNHIQANELILKGNAVPATRIPPKFSHLYFVQGVLLLPYAEINEPFKAYLDLEGLKSRIDYYGETVKTYQRYDMEEFGMSFKIAYMPDENGSPERTCFKVAGTEENPVDLQSILPNLDGFEYIKDESCFEENSLVDEASKGLVCELWRSTNEVGDKKNTYSMYVVKDTGEPKRYVMMGYNTLLGSHFDKYELYYFNYTDHVSDEDFEVDPSLECRDFPGPGVQNSILMNPMREYINNVDDHIHENFEDFKNKHSKVYDDDKEHERRKNIFRQNYRYVESMNRAGLSFGLKINHLADYTDFELHRIRGRLPSTGYNGGQRFPEEEFLEAIPESMDWRLIGAVTPVKDQAVCGSCWSFGTTGTIEGAYFLKTDKLVRLSQQQLIDCSWRYQNNGCDGGEDFRAYAYIMDAGGLASEDDYGHYMGQDGICHDSQVPKTAQITGFVNVTSGDLNALRQAIAKKGPISVSIDASHKSFSFYSHGVYYDPDCESGENQLDHSVLAVGYGVLNGQPYWIVKNSWSTYWGNDGYVLMSQKDNNCGVATSPTYVLM